MLVLSHRGFWNNPCEKNTKTAFERSFSLGFGTETDLRDLAGKIVISHDTPRGDEMSFSEFLTIFCKYNKDLPLALNIKSDGIHSEIKKALDVLDIQNYFVFDMSIPDTIGYFKNDLKYFLRESEYERIYDNELYQNCQGIWMDCFKSDWIEKSDIELHLENGKKVCIVSPDLHEREYLTTWRKYKNMNFVDNNVMLCTDYPKLF